MQRSFGHLQLWMHGTHGTEVVDLKKENPQIMRIFFRNLTLVTSVDQTWNSLVKGLEQIDAAFDELISSNNA